MFFPVAIAGLIEGLNPYSLVSLLFFLLVLSSGDYPYRQAVFLGIAFVGGMFAVNFFLSFGWLADFRNLEFYFVISKGLALFLAVLAIAVGVGSFYDWCLCVPGKPPQQLLIKIPRFIDREAEPAREKRSAGRTVVMIITMIVLGGLAVLFQAGSRDQIFLPVWSQLIQSPRLMGEAIFFIGLYSFMFILPFIVSLYILYLMLRSEIFLAKVKARFSMLKIIHSAIFFGVGIGLLYMLG